MNAKTQAEMSHEDGHDSSFELAIAVLRERISRMKEEDREDLYQLLPYLFSTDEEEASEAKLAVAEIMDQRKGNAISLEETLDGAEECEKWMAFVGEKVRAERLKRNWNQETLAEKAGLQQAHISKIENKVHSPNRRTLEKLAQAFDLPVGFFDPSEF